MRPPMPRHPLQSDLDHILAHTQNLWPELRGAGIFITGGTGFFGTWLLNTLSWANEKLDLKMEGVVLTRNADAFRIKAPELANQPWLRFHSGDINTFPYPDGRFSHVIHAATSTSAKEQAESPRLIFDSIVQGTERVLQFAQQSGAKKFLLTSSGAVYGKQPSQITHVAEDYSGAPDPLVPASAYGEGKRAAEFLCGAYHREFGIDATIARCFAFVGPYLPLDAHFAIGNFIGDALAGRPIQIKGDGTPYRSYLYSADLVIWLLTILLRGQPGRAYNLGSDDDRPLSEVAKAVATHRKGVTVQIHGKPDPAKKPERYVPSTARAQNELHLKQTVDLDSAIQRTMEWHEVSKHHL
jgi:nucleoside-diphosphate-sugar epimerase